MSTEHDTNTTATTVAAPPKGNANAAAPVNGDASPAVAKVKDLLPHNPDPRKIAVIIHESPAAKDAIMALLNQTVGASYARAVAELSHKEDLKAEYAAEAKDAKEHPEAHKHDKKKKKERTGPGYTKTGSESTRDALARLVAKGKLHLTNNQIGQMDAISNIETSGKAAAVDTTDDEVVSIGFHQLVLGSKSIQALMLRVPQAFSKHGLTLDTGKTYDFKSKPYQIVGAPHEELLRTHEWGDKFLAASGEDEVLAAMAEYVLQDQAKTVDLQHGAGGTASYFDDDTAKAWVTEYYNSRPAFTGEMLKRAVAAGANTATSRDQFLDILHDTIISSYIELETKRYFTAAKAKYKKAHKKDMPADEAAALFASKKADWDAIGKRKSTNIVTKIPRHIDLSKIHPPKDGAAPQAAPKADAKAAPQAAPQPAPAPKPAPLPVAIGGGDHHDAPVADHHEDHDEHHDAPKPQHHHHHTHHHHAKPADAEHHDDKHDDKHDEKPVQGAAPTPTVAPKPVEHHDVAPAQKPVETPKVTPVADDKHDAEKAKQPANAAGAHKYTIKPTPESPTVHAFTPPGGVKDGVEVFLFLHGMFAHHDRSEYVKTHKGAINDPNPEEAMGLAQAMAQTKRNLVTLAPVAHFSDEWPLWSSIHEQKGGWRGFIEGAIKKLSIELGANPPLSMASLSVAGHSAGGQGLGTIGEEMKDDVHDMTFEDAGYTNTKAWTKSHEQVANWFMGGEKEKHLRVILHDGGVKKGQVQHVSEEGVLDTTLNADHLHEVATKLKHPDVTFTRDEGNRDKRTVAGLHLNYRLHVQGLKGARVMSVFQFHDGTQHMGLRNKVTSHLITEDRDTEFVPGQANAAPAPNAPAPAPVPVSAPPAQAPAPKHDDDDHAKKPTVAKPHHGEHHDDDHHDDKPAVAPVKVDPKADPKVEHKEHKEKKAPKAKKKAHDDGAKVDEFGNSIVRKVDYDKNVADDKHRVFTNAFTVASKHADLLTAKGNLTGRHLPKNTVLHLHKVTDNLGQVEAEGVPLTDNLWINFKDLGGSGQTNPGFGNENTDATDKQRADAIKAKLPPGRNPGKSPFHWSFGGGFSPSMAGVALDGSLMAKVNLLMEWAIANDMVAKNIVLVSGMRNPLHAHRMCVRYRLAHEGGDGVDFDAIRALPDGKYGGWKFLPRAGATNAEIMQQAHVLYTEHGGSGAQAAAGYAKDSPMRSPLMKTAGPGVSKHCSGHAVDVTIPWRSMADPKKEDLWAYEEIYHQFGLLRPLHRDLGFTGHRAEHWHIEETGKQIDGVNDGAQGE